MPLFSFLNFAFIKKYFLQIKYFKFSNIIHSFVLATYNVSDIFPEAEDTTVNKKFQVTMLIELTLQWWRQIIEGERAHWWKSIACRKNSCAKDSSMTYIFRKMSGGQCYKNVVSDGKSY